MYCTPASMSQKPHSKLRPLKPKVWCSRSSALWVNQPNKAKPMKANKSLLIRGVRGLM
jgi:hypothetical protein